MPIRKTIRPDELKLIPTVVAVTATGSVTSTKPRQSNAVKNVLPTRDNFLPSPGLSINHAPNFIIIMNRHRKAHQRRKTNRKQKSTHHSPRTPSNGKNDDFPESRLERSHLRNAYHAPRFQQFWQIHVEHSEC